MSDRVQIDVADGVAHVRLNRPAKMNALDGAMFAAIAEAGETVATDASVRVVVLSGEGRAFCSGLDFGSFQAMADGPKADPGDSASMGAIGETDDRITHLGQQVAHVWQEVPVPVIAAIHGVALGGGIQIALGADIRIIAPDARMSVLEVKWGLVPDMTGTWMFRRRDRRQEPRRGPGGQASAEPVRTRAHRAAVRRRAPGDRRTDREPQPGRGRHVGLREARPGLHRPDLIPGLARSGPRHTHPMRAGRPG